jgi:large subunit ribosomal protein L4
MASLPLYNLAGKQTGTYEFDPDSLAPAINRQLLHDAVVMYQANLRMGTKRSLDRGEVRGATRKLYKQKGTGRARAGSSKAGHRRGGGDIHPVRPGNHGYRMNKKAIRLATRMALAQRIANGQVRVVDGLAMDAPKTKTIAGLFQAMGVYGQRTLLGTASHDPNVYRSARNIAGCEVAPASDFNALSLLRPRVVVIAKEALDQLKERSSAASA